VVDVGFDVDAGFVLEFLLAVFVEGNCFVELLSDLGGHHVGDVDIRQDGGFSRDKSQLVGAVAAGERPRGEPDVIRDQP
jgi:hypothetical protein